MSSKRPLSDFMENHYLHFNAAALVDAAKGYKTHLSKGRKMMVTLAGAMSTAGAARGAGSFSTMKRHDSGFQ